MLAHKFIIVKNCKTTRKLEEYFGKLDLAQKPIFTFHKSLNSKKSHFHILIITSKVKTVSQIAEIFNVKENRVTIPKGRIKDIQLYFNK